MESKYNSYFVAQHTASFFAYWIDTNNVEYETMEEAIKINRVHMLTKYRTDAAPISYRVILKQVIETVVVG
jgi:hypothetical protein